MWNPKYDKNELIYETETDIENRLVVAKGKGGGRRMDWEFGISRCKLLLNIYRMDNQQGPPYSTGNYIQYPVINHNGKEYEKECIYMYN